MNNIRIIPEAVITELKEIPIHSVCDNLGINYKGDCPSGHDSQGHNCFHTFPHTNTWNCFHCKDSGEKLRIDTIGLVETTLKVNFPEACNYLIEQFRPELRDKFTGISAEELQKITEKRQKTEQVYKALNYAMDYYTKKLWENKEAIDYLKGRKITEDFIRDNPYVKFGYAPLRQEDLRQELFSKFGEEITLATGLFSKSDKGVIYPTMKIWIEELKKEIPVITYSYQMGGQARYIIGRRFTPEMEGKIGVRRFSKLKLKDDGIIKNEIFGIDSLSNKNPQFKNSVLISEGLFDAILAIQNNIPCISPVTVTFSDKQLPEMCKTVRKFETVYIVPDPDSPGEKGAVETAKQLIKEGKSVKVVTLPRIDGVEKFDLADYFKQYTAEDFFQLCSQGISLIDFLIQSIPENTEKISLTKLLKDKEIIQIIQAIDAISQDYYKELLSKKFKLKSSTIKNLFQEVPGMDIKPVVKSKPLPPPPEDKETPPALPVFLFYTDTWNSEKFVSQHGENVKFCKLWGKWLLWTGQKWEIDKTGKIQQYVKATVKSLYKRSIFDCR
jgi:DNA primase